MEEFVYVTDDTYTKKQLLRMEHIVLKILSFDLTPPTSNQFLRHYILGGHVCAKTANLALVSLWLNSSSLSILCMSHLMLELGECSGVVVSF